LEEQQIIASFKDENRREIQQFYDLVRPKFLNWLKGNYAIGDVEAAGEIYQRSFTVVYLNAKKGKLDALESAVETYLFGVAKFVVQEWRREQETDVQLFADQDGFENEIRNY